MSVGDWITIISITFAVVAIYPASERTIISYKLRKYELPLFVIYVMVILYLIKFDEIANDIPFLKFFYSDFGIQANDWALLLFLGLLFYYAWRLFYKIPNTLPKEKLIQYYEKKLNQDFDAFFELFNKYERKSSDIKYFESYRQIVFNSKFVAATSNRNPYLFVSLLDKMDNETFKPFFIHVLNDFKSVFYIEIKNNYNSNSVEPSNDFLYTVCHKNPKLFIDIGGLRILREWYILHLKSEKMAGIYSLYNQSPEPLIDDYGFKLPLFHHISFIELLYNEAINEHYDFSLLSNRYSNMQSIFSTIIERIIENIDVGSYETCSDKEYPLGYHFLISKIFGVIGHWLYTFCDDENYDKENSLTVFIPFCFSLSVNSLFKGLKNNKISLDFIKRLYRYHLFETYFSNKLKPEIEKEINERCIKEIPNEHLQSILEFSLDEILAVSYYSFISPSTENDSCNRQQQSLHKFLKENSMI